MKLTERIEIKKSYFKVKKQKFRRDTQKFAIKLIRFFTISDNKINKVNNSENEVVSLCRRLIRDNDSVLSMTSKTLKRIIDNKITGTYIIIRNMQVLVYHKETAYPPIIISDKKYLYLLEIFDIKKEEIENEKEKEIDNKVKNSFKMIYANIVQTDLIEQERKNNEINNIKNN